MKAHVLGFDHPLSKTHTDIHAALYERNLKDPADSRDNVAPTTFDLNRRRPAMHASLFPTRLGFSLSVCDEQHFGTAYDPYTGSCINSCPASNAPGADPLSVFVKDPRTQQSDCGETGLRIRHLVQTK